MTSGLRWDSKHRFKHMGHMFMTHATTTNNHSTVAEAKSSTVQQNCANGADTLADMQSWMQHVLRGLSVNGQIAAI